jgi:hypothetical protein
LVVENLLNVLISNLIDFIYNITIKLMHLFINSNIDSMKYRSDSLKKMIGKKLALASQPSSSLSATRSKDKDMAE